MKKFLSIILAILMVVTMIPLSVLPASAAGTFVEDIAIAADADKATAQGKLTSNGYTLIDVDLNKGCGSGTDYIYIGYKTTTKPNKAIRSILFLTPYEGEIREGWLSNKSAYHYPIGCSEMPNGSGDGFVNLNNKAGGTQLYMYVSREIRAGAPLTEMMINGSSSQSGYSTAVYVFSEAAQNLNEGTSGDALYLHYKDAPEYSGLDYQDFNDLYLELESYLYKDSVAEDVKQAVREALVSYDEVIELNFANEKQYVYEYTIYIRQTLRDLQSYIVAEESDFAAIDASLVNLDSVLAGVSVSDIITQEAASIKADLAAYRADPNTTKADVASLQERIDTILTVVNNCKNGQHEWSDIDGSCLYGCGAVCSHDVQSGTCGICGAEIHTCDFSGKWNSAPANHWKQCACGKTAQQGAHTWSNGVCLTCSYACTHPAYDANKNCTVCGSACAHSFTNGFCSVNGCYEAPVLKDGYYQIDNAGKLFWFANYVNTVDRTANAVLTADIDLENSPWTPIGSTGENSNNFRGIFDGQNHTIKGLYVEGGRAGLGFFGEVRTGTVKNFTIYGEVVANTEVDYIGGVIGSVCGVNGENDLERNGAIIQNITSYVNLTAKAHGIGMIGGFVGYANHESLIEKCAWYGTFDAGIYRVDSGAGGFIGKIQENTSEVTIRNCGAYGTIKTNYAKNSYNNTATIYMGGFLSFTNTNAKTVLENCLFAGKFERGANLTDQALLGAFGTVRSVNSIKNCYYLGDDGLEAVHGDSPLKPGSGNVEITKVTAEQLKSGEVAAGLGELWFQGEGYPFLKELTPHSHQYTYTDNGDGTHDKECLVCDYVKVDNEAHSGGTATCTTQAVCESCGASYGEVAADAHDWSNNDGVCANGCGAECTHENQTGSVCEICGAELHVCDFTGEWKYDADKHWKECSCGLKSEEGTHTGGTATCTTQAVCETCGASYGEVAADAHDWSNKDGICANGCGTECTHENQTGSVCEVCGAELHVCDFTGEWKYDADKHWKECSCGLTSEEGTHTGGTATCVSGKLCETCGNEYGEADADNHDWSNNDGVCANGCGFSKILVEIRMHDEYNDGWTGNALLIKDVSGTEIGTATIENGAEGTYTFRITEDEVFTLTWQEGEYPSECTFDVAVDGVTVFESETGDYYVDGEVVYTYCDHTFENSVCTKCNQPCEHPNVADGECPDCGFSGMLVEIRLHDDWEDGWTGNTLLIKDSSGATIGTATITKGSEKTYTLLIAENEVFTLTWQEGEYPSECTFDVAVDGATVFKSKSGDNYEDGEVVYTYCDHTFENSVCTKCGQACEHLNVAEGKCSDCGCNCMLVEIKMYDKYNNGWNGNSLLIKDSSGTTIGTATFTMGSEETYAFPITENEVFTLTWQKKDDFFASECTFDVVVDGATVFESTTGDNYADGEVVYTNCDHTFENSVCIKCGTACAHENQTGNFCEVCGTSLHTCDFTGEWKADAEKHWKECECGLLSEEGTHTGGEATCTEKAVCETCGNEYGDADADNHDWSDDDGICVNCGISSVLVEIRMHDAFGDGWNDNTLLIKDGSGTEIGTATIENGAEGTYTFRITEDEGFTLTWQKGNSPNECTFDVAVDGVTVFESKRCHNYADGEVVYTYCNHTFENSVCTKCGQACEHPNVADGKCSDCGCNCMLVEISMQDTYGDSWGDNALLIKDSSGTTIGTATIEDGAEGTYSFLIAENEVFTLIWQKSNFPQECTFDVAVDGVTVFKSKTGDKYANDEVVYTYCDHTFENSVCTKCDQACEHLNVAEGKCSDCGCNCMLVEIRMHDEYSDGWADNALLIKDDSGTEIGTATIKDGAEGTYSFLIAENEGFTLTWQKGDYPIDCTFEVAVDGVTVFESETGDNYADDEVVYTYCDHTFENSVCTKCGIVCAHENQTGAVCEVCGKTLHVCDFSGEWKYDADKHWKECTADDCDKISEKTEHEFMDGECTVCDYVCDHANATNSLIRPVQNADGTWGQGSIVTTCPDCGNVDTEFVNRADYTAFDAAVEELSELLAKADLIDGPKQDYTSTLSAVMNGVSADRIESEQSTVSNGTQTLNNIISTIKAGLADNTMKKADLSYMTALLDEVNALIDSNPNNIIPSEIGKYYGPNNYHKAQLNNGNFSQAAHDSNMATYDYENQLETLLAGLKDGSMRKADYSVIDEVIAGIDEALETATVSDEMQAELDGIKKELDALKSNAITSVADLANSGLLARAEAIAETMNNCANGVHVFTNYEVVDEPACEVEGKKVAVCDNGCGATDEKEIAALAHKPIAAVVENEVAPKCEVAGSYDLVVYCDICGEELDRDTITVDALEHSFTKYEVTEEAKCGVAGKEVATCDNGCGATDEREIPALTHEPLAAVVENEVDAECEKAGSYDLAVYCELCGEELDRDTVTVDALTHTDEDGDYLCDHGCGHEFPKPVEPEQPDTPDTPDEPTDDTCDHICHSGNTLMRFFWKIIRFFQKLFGIQQYCDCGVTHW